MAELSPVVTENPSEDLERPIRVVFFRGPFLERAGRNFFVRLGEHPEVEIVGGFCQAPGESLGDRLRDLRKRRGVLGLPILASWVARAAVRFAFHPRSESAFQRKMARVKRRVALVSDIHAPEVLEQVRNMAPDLGLIYGGPILKPDLFEIPRFGTLSIHHGRLPEYRGKKTTFWEIYNGEETAGTTIQRINAGIDTGEVVLRGGVPIGRKTYGRVSSEVQELGVELYLDAVLRVKRGTATFEPAAPKKGPHYRDPRPSDYLRLWRRRLQGARRSSSPGSPGSPGRTDPN